MGVGWEVVWREWKEKNEWKFGLVSFLKKYNKKTEFLFISHEFWNSSSNSYKRQTFFGLYENEFNCNFTKDSCLDLRFTKCSTCMCFNLQACLHRSNFVKRTLFSLLFHIFPFLSNWIQITKQTKLLLPLATRVLTLFLFCLIVRRVLELVLKPSCNSQLFIWKRHALLHSKCYSVNHGLLIHMCIFILFLIDEWFDFKYAWQ